VKLNERIAFHRKRLGLSTREVADIVGVDDTLPYHWEREGGSSPIFKNLTVLVEKAFGMTLSEFFADEPTTPDLPTIKEPSADATADATAPEAA
jgi:transcriptional regulator with XRE-family HTH domain